MVSPPCSYHWRELPQVLFLSGQKFSRDKHVFVVTKHVFCGDKSMLETKLETKCETKLLRRPYTHVFVATKVLSRKNNSCGSSRQWYALAYGRCNGLCSSCLFAIKSMTIAWNLFNWWRSLSSSHSRNINNSTTTKRKACTHYSNCTVINRHTDNSLQL